MEFQNTIIQLSNRVRLLKEEIQTEEATKTSLIMPFIQALGYDVFNPTEVIPEFTCDVGTKKGEKVDYAIMSDDKPIILMECKHWSQDLSLHDNQLLRYYNVSDAHFGVLTNGIKYRFYTDLSEENKMDDKPFLEIDLLDLRDYQIKELKKFHKSHFDLNSIFDTASDLKYTGELKIIINNEFNNPSPDFVKFFARLVYDGVLSQKRLEEFTPLVKKSLATYVSDLITSKFKNIMSEEKEIQKNNEEAEDTKDNTIDSRIVTTEEELEGFMIVKAMIREVCDIERVAHRDAISYFSVLFDDNNRKPICRLHFNGSTKYIVIFDKEKQGTRYDVDSLNDLFKYKNLFNAVAAFYNEE